MMMKEEKKSLPLDQPKNAIIPSEKGSESPFFENPSLEVSKEKSQQFEGDEARSLRTYCADLEEQADEPIARNRLEEAIIYLNKARLACPSDNLTLAKLYGKLGRVNNESEKYDEAFSHHSKSYEIRLKRFQGEHNEPASDSLNELGLVMHLQGRIDEALQNFQKSLNIRQLVAGEFSIKVADSYNNLGNVHFDQGELEKAYESHNKCYNIYLKCLAPNDLRIALSLNNIGRVLDEQHLLPQIASALRYIRPRRGSRRC